MGKAGSIFLDVNLPNPATWFYFSLLLAVALFFKFSRFLSMRNLDIVTLFLLVPGFLLLRENPANWYGYLWLICGSSYFLARCLIDLALVRRPALSPNLALGGLAWLAGTLFICLITVAIRQQPTDNEVGKEPALIEKGKELGKPLFPTDEVTTANTGRTTRFWEGCILALVCHLAIVAGLIFIGWRHFQDVHSGMAAATFYLLLPYTAFHVWEANHVLPSALIVWAVAAYRKPGLAGMLLGLAAGLYFPVVLFPLWLSFYWRRGAGRFAAAAGLSLAVIGGILFVAGDLFSGIRSVLALSDWQPWKVPDLPGPPGVWQTIHWAYRIPVFIAYLAFVAGTAFWPTPKNLAHLVALSAALLIGIQFWYADQGGVYVLWYLPLLLLVVFRPNLSDRRPFPINRETDWLYRFGRVLSQLVHRYLRPAAPVVRVK